MPRFGIKEVANCTFISLIDNKPKLFLNTLKLSNLENAADTSYATGGKGNSRLLAWDYNRVVTFNIQDALLNPKSLSLQSGNDLVNGNANIHSREVLTADVNSKVVFTNTPVENSITIYKTSDNYEHGTEQTESTYDPNGVKATGTLTFTGSVALGETVAIGADTYEFDDGAGVAIGNIAVNVGADLTADNAITKLVSAINTSGTEPVSATGDTTNDKVTVTHDNVGTTGNSVGTSEAVANASWGSSTLTGGQDVVTDAYLIDVDGKTIIFNKTSVPQDDEVIGYYQYQTAGESITISTDSFPGYYKVIGDTVLRNEATGADESFQIIIEKAKIQPNFTVTLQSDGDPSLFDMGIEVFKPKKNTEMVKMVRY
jgi:hypothetical protein